MFDQNYLTAGMIKNERWNILLQGLLLIMGVVVLGLCE